MKKQIITISTKIKAPVALVWKTWTDPEDILQWNAASQDWHTTQVENDLSIGGRFTYRMEAKDGSFGFDFGGIYNEVKDNKLIIYTLDDDRKVEVIFEHNGDTTKVTESFEAESANPVDMQKNGWQAILDNFKSYTESKK